MKFIKAKVLLGMVLFSVCSFHIYGFNHDTNFDLNDGFVETTVFFSHKEHGTTDHVFFVHLLRNSL